MFLFIFNSVLVLVILVYQIKLNKNEKCWNKIFFKLHNYILFYLKIILFQVTKMLFFLLFLVWLTIITLFITIYFGRYFFSF